MRSLVAIGVSFAACSGPSNTTTAVPSPVFAGGSGSAAAPTGIAPLSTAPAVKVTLADIGLEASSLDRTADPCVDFYQFACGGWLANNQIPPDRARWSRFSEVGEKNNAAIKAILESAASGIGVDAGMKKLGDYYASCMDEASIDRSGASAIKPVLDRTTKVKDAKTWMAAVIELHRMGAWVVWDARAHADLKDSTTNVTYLDAAGLGLPDRDYYLKVEFRDKLDAYKAHVARTLVLAGTAPVKSEAAAADVIAIETELARLTKTASEKREVLAAYSPTDAKGLAKQVRSVDWGAYWRALGIEPSKKLVVASPKFFPQIDKLRTRFKPQQWASYLTYHLVQHVGFALPKTYEDEAFELQRVVSGVEKQKERSKRCIDATQTALGELLGQQYVTKYFPASAKTTANMLVDALVRAMSDELGKVDWLSDVTRLTAQQKLAKVVRMVGYPDKWRVYDFEVRRDDFAGNAMRALAFEARRKLAKSGKPVDRSEWPFDTYTVSAYYEPTANNTTLPAGILQAPFFGPDRSVAANLGGIGMLIGHELTHAFDHQGRQFDGDGSLVDWWRSEDASKFEVKAKCVVDQYAGFEAMKGSFINGKLTLGENIADMGGVKMAFHAYRALRKDAPKVYVADGFTEDQQFFIAAGQAWCSKDRPTESQRRLTSDPHAPPKFRIYGSLRNLPELARAFKCAPGTPMNPAKTCTVW